MNNITLWNLNEYSLQDIFDKVATHLLTQNKKSQDYFDLTGKLYCTYRNLLEDNTILKCAIGCLVPDDKYNESFEGKYVVSLIDYLNLNIDTNKKDLLIHLQIVHDSRSVKDWKVCLKDVADIFGLSVDNLNKSK